MREIDFLLAIWKTNLLSIMEFHTPFLTQVIGMMLNDFIYFASGEALPLYQGAF